MTGDVVKVVSPCVHCGGRGRYLTANRDLLCPCRLPADQQSPRPKPIRTRQETP